MREGMFGGNPHIWRMDDTATCKAMQRYKDHLQKLPDWTSHRSSHHATEVGDREAQYDDVEEQTWRCIGASDFRARH